MLHVYGEDFLRYKFRGGSFGRCHVCLSTWCKPFRPRSDGYHLASSADYVTTYMFDAILDLDGVPAHGLMRAEHDKHQQCGSMFPWYER